MMVRCTGSKTMSERYMLTDSCCLRLSLTDNRSKACYTWSAKPIIRLSTPLPMGEGQWISNHTHIILRPLYLIILKLLCCHFSKGFPWQLWRSNEPVVSFIKLLTRNPDCILQWANSLTKAREAGPCTVPKQSGHHIHIEHTFLLWNIRTLNKKISQHMLYMLRYILWALKYKQHYFKLNSEKDKTMQYHDNFVKLYNSLHL